MNNIILFQNVFLETQLNFVEVRKTSSERLLLKNSFGKLCLNFISRFYPINDVKNYWFGFTTVS